MYIFMYILTCVYAYVCVATEFTDIGMFEYPGIDDAGFEGQTFMAPNNHAPGPMYATNTHYDYNSYQFYNAKHPHHVSLATLSGYDMVAGSHKIHTTP